MTMYAPAFAEEIQLHDRSLKAFAMQLTKDKSAADDLVQDTLLKAFKNRGRFVQNTNLKAWLITIMKNTFINNYRKHQRRQRIENNTQKGILSIPRGSSVNNEGEEKLHSDQIMELVDSLSENLRIPFLMAYRGYCYEEICQHLDLPMGTVKSRIFMARKHLKTKIKVLNLV